jgi:NAD-reducing hydrogenase small subunit
MSFLDIDERLFTLLEHIEFDRSPLTDIKDCQPGLRHRHHRRRPVQRRERPCAARVPQELQDPDRHRRLRDQRRPAGAAQPPAADDHPRRGLSHQPGAGQRHDSERPELPLPLNKVHPIHEVVKVDYFIPGCPPSGDAIWKVLTDLLAGASPNWATA